MSKLKNEILELRKNGLSYNQIKNKLGCSKSTISYHCNNYNLSKPINKIDKDIIKKIEIDSEYLTEKEISIKYNISKSSVNRYRIFKKNKKKNKKTLNKCKNCDSDTINKFCSSECSSEYTHKSAYDKFLNENEKYCKPNYVPKQFKDFFLKEQNNKCDICGCEPKWNNKTLVFVLDHIDGDASNNKRENIRLICPNCDSQTDTFKSKNKVSTRRNYWKEKIINDINNGGDPSGMRGCS